MKTNNANDCSYTEVEPMQRMIKYLITCTPDNPFEDMITKFDPVLLSGISLTLTSMIGGSCSLAVEQMEMIAVEENDEEDDE